MHVRITKPDGTVIDVDGTPQECAALLDTLTATPVQITPVANPGWVLVPYVYPQCPVNPLSYPYYASPNVTDVIITSTTALAQH